MKRLEFADSDNGRKIIIEIDETKISCDTLEDFYESLIRPLLLALTYTEHTVNSLGFLSDDELTNICGCSFCLKLLRDGEEGMSEDEEIL